MEYHPLSGLHVVANLPRGRALLEEAERREIEASQAAIRRAHERN